MSEAAFWSKLRLVLPRGAYSRVENIVEPGMPDVSFCIPNPSDRTQSWEGWFELKSSRKLPLEHRLLRSQILWMDRRIEHGAKNIWILVRHQKIVYFVHPVYREWVNDWREPEFKFHCHYTDAAGFSKMLLDLLAQRIPQNTV